LGAGTHRILLPAAAYLGSPSQNSGPVIHLPTSCDVRQPISPAISIFASVSTTNSAAIQSQRSQPRRSLRQHRLYHFATERCILPPLVFQHKYFLHDVENAFKDNPQYAKDNYHWASSSSQPSACTVEPGTVDDVGKIVSFPSIRNEYSIEFDTDSENSLKYWGRHRFHSV
jgi:hypothetical protein